MSSLPIREPQDACSTDESGRGAILTPGDDTNHHEYLINNSPAFFSPSNRSHDHDHDHDHDHATDVHSEAPSDLPESPDHVSEAASSDHTDWSPVSPLISAPGYSGTSSDADADAITEDTTAANPQSLPEDSSLLPLPTSSPGPLTHAHQQAMANRIIYDQILPGAGFDPAVYTPVFLHDTLMLPGSLATVIGKVRYPVFI
jgi:hypothetical protein